MPLIDEVTVARRFQRSIRIDTDLTSPDALTGFICPESSAGVLTSMATHLRETGQGAFTWTGPYGSGKSSLVIALSALTGQDHARRAEAKASIGQAASVAIDAAFPFNGLGWSALPVIGRRDAVCTVISEALKSQGFFPELSLDKASDSQILHLVENLSQDSSKRAGLIIFIDEMGKFLEAAGKSGGDLYFFQLLAELASRSNGRLVVVGVLHQAFEEYANRLSRDARDEWSKIQGRYVDLAVNTAGEEQLDLLSRAIQTNHRREPSVEAVVVAAEVKRFKPSISDNFSHLLEDTWPLHPIVACLLGPISRRRFGQNQRSLFGFLNSAEPFGFQDYLRTEDDHGTYKPDRLWDYLRFNLEPSIISSPDGHRWAMAAEALDRCEANGGGDTHSKLFKTIALLDMFRERSGLSANAKILFEAVQGTIQQKEIALRDLQSWSLIIYRKHLDAFSVFAGSDFNIEAAVERALQDVHDVHFETLQNMAGIQPILAKRHYFDHGSLRWLDVKLGSVSAASSTIAHFSPDPSLMGQILLTLPTYGEDLQQAERACKEASRRASQLGAEIIVGYPKHAWGIIELARELKALEKVQEDRPELQGDPVARKEISNRLIVLQNQLESELQSAFSSATWFRAGKKIKPLNQQGLSSLASEIASELYPDSPRIQNELLNRTKPSSNAIAAQNLLLKAMVLNEGTPRLGIEGYPAEGGLFDSLLLHTKLYSNEDSKFKGPHWANDATNLCPAWDAAIRHLKENQNRSVPLTEVFDVWENRPYGIKRGLMPTLATALLLATKNEIAIYREDIFQSAFSDLDVDYLARDPSSIQVRWTNLGSVPLNLLKGLSSAALNIVPDAAIDDKSSISVARALVGIYDALPAWTKRTQRLTARSKKLRSLLKSAYDPNQLLYTDIPAAAGIHFIPTKTEDALEIVSFIEATLEELSRAYPDMISLLQETMMNELRAKPHDVTALDQLRKSASAVKQISGDFRVDAFINRLALYTGERQQIEGIASLAANKPPVDWIDTDMDKALIEIVSFCQCFLRTETFSRVKNKTTAHRSISIVTSRAGSNIPLHAEFDINQEEQTQVSNLVDYLTKALKQQEANSNVILAALAELSCERIESSSNRKSLKDKIA
jgi:hypothetical protein